MQFDDLPVRGSKAAPRRETPYAQAAYAAYAAMGPTRSIRKLAREWKEGKGSFDAKVRWLGILSSRFNWQERVREYDLDKIEARRERRERRFELMNDRHYEIGENAIEIALEQIQRIADENRFGAQAAGQLLQIASTLQRTAVDAERAEEKQQGPGQIQIVILTDTPDNPEPRQISANIVDAG